MPNNLYGRKYYYSDLERKFAILSVSHLSVGTPLVSCLPCTRLSGPVSNGPMNGPSMKKHFSAVPCNDIIGCLKSTSMEDYALILSFLVDIYEQTEFGRVAKFFYLKKLFSCERRVWPRRPKPDGLDR